MNQSAASHLSDVLAHIFDDHFIRRDGLHGKQAPVVDVRLAESDLLLSELGTENGEESVRKVHSLLCLSRWCSCSLLFFSNIYKKRPLEPKSCWFVYLQLVELQQVTVAGKRGQQTSLLWPTLRASSGGGVDLCRNAHALQRQDGNRWDSPQSGRATYVNIGPSSVTICLLWPTCVSTGGSSDCSFVLWRYLILSFLSIL